MWKVYFKHILMASFQILCDDLQKQKLSHCSNIFEEERIKSNSLTKNYGIDRRFLEANIKHAKHVH